MLDLLRSINLKHARVLNKAVTSVTSREYLHQLLTLPLYRNAFFLIGDAGLTALGGFFFWVVVARFYSETEVGYSSAILSAINLLLLISLAGQGFSIVRFLSQSDKPRELINSSFTLSGLISLVAAVIFIAGLGFWSPALRFMQQQIIFAITFIGITLIAIVSALTDSVFMARRKAGFVLLKTAIFSLLKIPLPILFASFLHSFGVITSWGMALGISLAISLFLLIPKVEENYKPVPTLRMPNVKYISRYAFGSYISNLLAAAPIMVLPIMVLNLLGTKSNAYFYVASQIAHLLSAIPWAVSQSLFAEGSFSESTIRQNTVRAIKFDFLLVIPALLLLIVAAKWLLLAFGQSYAENSLNLVRLLSLTCLPLMIFSVYTSLLRVQNRLVELVIIRGLFAVSTLALSFFLMPKYGMVIGIGCVWLGTYIAIGIYSALRLSTWLRQSD